MTDHEERVCALGCTERGTDKPRPAIHGQWLCRRCSKQLHGWLVSIPGLFDQLSIDLTTAPQTDGGTAHRKVSGSPALVRLDVMAMLDPRTQPGPGEVGPDGKAEPDDGIVDVAGAIIGWAELLAESRGLTTAPGSITEAVNLLTAWWSTVCARPWVDDMYRDIRKIHHQLWRATDQPEPLGRCFGYDPTRPCGGPVMYEIDTETSDVVARCQIERCGRRYDGADLVRLQLQTERENAS